MTDSGARVTGVMTPGQIRDALLSLPDNDRKFIITNPDPGQHKVISLKRISNDNIAYDFETVPE